MDKYGTVKIRLPLQEIGNINIQPNEFINRIHEHLVTEIEFDEYITMIKHEREKLLQNFHNEVGVPYETAIQTIAMGCCYRDNDMILVKNILNELIYLAKVDRDVHNAYMQI